MAKRKMTARQKAAKKRAAYYRSEYYKNVDAISFLSGFTKTKPITIPKKITKSSLAAIRKVYNEVKKSLQKINGGYLDTTTGEWFEKLPSKQEMVKQIRSEPTQQYRKYRAEPEEAPSDFDPDLQYLEDLRDKLNQLSPLRDSNKTDKNYQTNVVPKFIEARNRILGAIDYATVKVGAGTIAAILAGNSFIQRIANLEEKYTHEIVESIDDDLIPLIESSVGEALDSI